MRRCETLTTLRQADFNKVSAAFVGECGKDIAKGAAKFEEITGTKAEPEKFTVFGQDLVEQACGLCDTVTITLDRPACSNSAEPPAKPPEPADPLALFPGVCALQLITGVGFRITGECTANGTRSVLINSQDPIGAKFVITTREVRSPENGIVSCCGSRVVMPSVL